LSFPVAGTFMIEPTESESKAEIDTFCNALLQIREEIKEVENGTYTKEENVLTLSPFSAKRITADKWDYNFTRSKAAYPLPIIRDNKYWVPIARVDNAYGDRNLICSCPSVESYAEELV
jgi:glycine dehydrogenase